VFSDYLYYDTDDADLHKMWKGFLVKDISSANEKPRFSEVIRPSREFYESRGATGEDERKLISIFF
jgi:hypothetical protein